MQKNGEKFVLVDVRSEMAWVQRRIIGAIHFPYREIPARAGELIPAGTPVIGYCWSPGCNAGAKGALEFAKLGYSVREKVGGFKYWVREGQPTENDQGGLPRTVDGLVMIVPEPATVAG